MFDQTKLKADAALAEARKKPLRVLRITSERHIEGQRLVARVMFTDLRARLVKGVPGGRWKVHLCRNDPRRRVLLNDDEKAQLERVYVTTFRDSLF